MVTIMKQLEDMKELKKQIMELLQQKLSVYGFKKKQYFAIIKIYVY